jgi:hypothetical protein
VKVFFVIGLGLALAGCSVQERYAYPGCESAKYYCTNDLTFACAIKTEASHFDACTTADECVQVVVENCIDVGGCGTAPAVNKSHADEFRAAFERETKRYCEDSGCREAGSCVPRTTLVTCNSGHCGLEFNPDGGT